MLLELGREVDVREHVAVQHQQPLLEQTLLVREPHGSAGPERFVLGHVAQAHALIDVAEHGLDRI